MNRVDVWLDAPSLLPALQVGSLHRDSSRSGDAIRFEYAADWLANPHAFALDPELPLHAGPHHVAGPSGTALPRIFRDAAPDRWGRVLMERREAEDAKDEGRLARSLHDWDFLLGVDDATRMGALRLFDPERQRYVDDHAKGVPPVARLRELEAVATALDAPGAESRPEYRSWLDQLITPGSSLGGARPKATFRDEDGSLWLAKFPASDDRRDVGGWEYLAWQLAADAGIAVPPARLQRFSARGHTFMTRRFDRTGRDRLMYASAMTLAVMDDGDQASYLDLVQAIEHGAVPARIASELEQLFRRALFSVLVGNRDDHLRNHGFVRTAGGWRLAPAFDINPNPDKHVHALTLDGEDARPSSKSLLDTVDFYRLTPQRAERIHDEVRRAVAGWEDVASRLGLPGAEVTLMRGVIDPQR